MPSTTSCRACGGRIGPAGSPARGLCSRCAYENPEPLSLAGLPPPPSQFTAAGFEKPKDPK